MRWVVYPLACVGLVVILLWIGLHLLGRHLKARAYDAGLHDYQPSTKPLKGYLWLYEQEMRQWMADQKRKEGL